MPTPINKAKDEIQTFKIDLSDADIPKRIKTSDSLYTAVLGANIAEIKELIQGGATVSEKTSKLFFSLDIRDSEIAKNLFVTIPNEMEKAKKSGDWTRLQYAVYYANINHINVLIQAGANENELRDPVFQKDVLYSLLDYSSDSGILNLGGRYSREKLTQSRVLTLRLLFDEYGANPNLPMERNPLEDNEIYTNRSFDPDEKKIKVPLVSYSVLHSSSSLLSEILSKNPDLNALDEEGRPVEYYLMERGEYEHLELVASKKEINWNYEDTEGNGLFHIFLDSSKLSRWTMKKTSFQKTLMTLFEKCNPEHENKYGKTVWNYISDKRGKPLNDSMAFMYELFMEAKNEYEKIKRITDEISSSVADTTDNATENCFVR